MKKDQIDKIDPARRGMLKKLGLAAVAAYATPVMLKLSEAHADSSDDDDDSSSSSSDSDSDGQSN